MPNNDPPKERTLKQILEGLKRMEEGIAETNKELKDLKASISSEFSTRKKTEELRKLRK